jgi:hypothetical protein
MRKLLLECEFSPGDLVMLTAAVRDLHRSYPGEFLTDVRAGSVELWDNNPFRTRLSAADPEVEVIKCDIPLINRSNQAPYHYIHAFIHFLNERLGLKIEPTEFKGDIYISPLEKSWWSQVQDLTGQDTPFWIVSAGGKFDVTIKWWETARYQKVIDHFRGKILFVQVGRADHYHPRLNGTVDLRGKTNLRELVRLVHHAQGLLCGVTCLMHLAAAVETRPGRPSPRPCVVIAGGREPVHWEAYSHHQFIHTIGALECCQSGGCWRDRTLPLRDGAPQDSKKNRCLQVAGALPRCMDMITPDEVIRRIEMYFVGGAAEYLSAPQWLAAQKAIGSEEPSLPDCRLTEGTVRASSEVFLAGVPKYPRNFAGRGIVICGGGVTYFPAAWVCIRILRMLGCRLPIQLWHLGKEEFSPTMEKLVTPLDVECVDASEVRKAHPARILNGWELKPYSIIHSRFEEVLLLDADNMPVRNPEYLFETAQFRDTGAVFWPDFPRPEPPKKVWNLCGIKYRRERNFESGQILVNKRKTWRALSLAMWYNENSDFFYRRIYGDKETFHLAFRKTGTPYSMPSRGMHGLPATMCHHDFQGRRIFQHRNNDLWNLLLCNRRIPGFRFEDEARTFLKELRSQWDGQLGRYPRSMFKSKRPSGSGKVKIDAWMVSCDQRAAVRRKTLELLSSSDWGANPVRVHLDSAEESDQKARMVRAYRETLERSLEVSLESGSEYILVLEDDLIFNRHFRHNLQNWEPLRQGYLDFGSLYNPNARPDACSVSGCFYLSAPARSYGSQAYIFSREWVRYLVTHWEEETRGLADIRTARLTANASKPLFYHLPSLVQHAPVKSTWGGDYHSSHDFHPTWKAPCK